MELKHAEIYCYRRFADSTNVRLNENLIAVIGTNEAGKSSFLDALEELNDNEPISDYNSTRDKNCEPEISATFNINDHEREELSSIEGADNITEWTLTKHANGELTAETDSTLDHDLTPRQNVVDSLEDIRENNSFQSMGSRTEQRERSNKLNELQSDLQSERAFLGEETIDTISELGSNLISLVEQSDGEADHTKSILNFGKQLESLAEHEDKCPPYRAKEWLKQHRPQFIPFTDEDRQLKNQYDLKKYSNEYPAALENLAELADLDLDELLEAARTGNRPYVHTLRQKATEELESAFSRSWVQEEIVPAIDVNDTSLHLHIQTLDEEGYSNIENRSDGLRWFISLRAFLDAKQAGKNPILLIDEAEQHLSYDAQASLIEVLESQNLANTVIYTTHSAGCLPSDLGRGIRPIIPDEAEERSEIKNGFWQEGEGFSPLMMAMGLSSFAFTVSRNVLIGEGASECILLPSLIRAATEREELKYQVAPGLSTVGSGSLEDLLSESGRTAFVVDGDEAGREYRDSLSEKGVDEGQIFSYSDDADKPIVLEDLINPDVYAEAVSEEIEYWQSQKWDAIGERLTPSELPDHGRDSAVQEWCNQQGYDPVQKTTLSQRLAKKAGSGEDIVDSDRRDILIRIDRHTQEYFNIDRD